MRPNVGYRLVVAGLLFLVSLALISCGGEETIKEVIVEKEVPKIVEVEKQVIVEKEVPTIVEKIVEKEVKVAVASHELEWEQTLAAAQEEGVVSVIGHESELRRAIVKDEFEARFPGIKVEYLGLPGGEADARCESEWAAGAFSYDAVMARCTTFLFDIADRDGLQAIGDLIILPDLLEPHLWVGGFGESYLDTQDRYVFSFGAFSLSITWQRTDLHPQAEITKVGDLLDEKYSGKICFADPRTDFLSNYQTAFLYEGFGEAGLRKVFIDNNAQIFGTGEQLIDTMIRTDDCWLAVGFPDHRLKSFQDAGLAAAENVEPTAFSDAMWMGRTNGFIAVPKDNPHPNATKIWVNWLLGREAQELWSFNSGEPSARLDVPVGTPSRWPDPARGTWKNFQTEEFQVNTRLLNPTRDLVTEILDELGK